MTTTPKRERVRLARSELLVQLATTAERWRKELLHEEGCGTISPEEWGGDDPFVQLARAYDLSYADLARICDKLGDDFERRALRSGYEEAWLPRQSA